MQKRCPPFARRLVRSLSGLTAALLLLAPLAARAQSDASSRALAVQLFDEAEALLNKNQVAEACPKYAESYRLDPQLGVLIYLGECYEKNGQLASAWGSLREAEELARKRGDPRADQARERAAALEPRLSYLLIQVPATARVPGLELMRDGAPIAPLLWGGRAAIDPGTHQLEARAPGYKAWRGEVTVAATPGTTQVDVPKLEAEPKSLGAKGAKGSASASASGTSQRIAALAVGGLGVAGVGVGGFFGLSAQASLSDSKDFCNDDDYCTPRGVDLRSSASSKALVATVATGVGVAALATAAVLWFTAPSSTELVSAPARSRAWAVGPSTRGWGLEATRTF